MNLQIANAALRSGFNTNAEALMDLIWAVRRVTFIHGVQVLDTHRRHRPPKQ